MDDRQMYCYALKKPKMNQPSACLLLHCSINLLGGEATLASFSLGVFRNYSSKKRVDYRRNEKYLQHVINSARTSMCKWSSSIVTY